MTNNSIANTYNDQMNDGGINLIEEFMNTNEEENKLINLVRDEFIDMKFFNYGALIYLQNRDDVLTFPHVSELLENYEKIFSVDCFTQYLVLRMTKYYVIYNDGLIILSEDGLGDMLNIFKVKNVVIFYNLKKQECNFGKVNIRILKILKNSNLI